ncbi:MAG: hypothetical protein KDE08_13440 [Rhodobacteraceae bacterium]|nr:hypothetical protein [Paracoccaceae bacterium]
MQHIAAIGLAGAIVIALAWFGLPERLGAHPFWAVKIGFLGLLPGAVAALLFAWLRLPRMAEIGFAAVLVAASFATAKVGAARFAASYAEDALAGRLWFFGWIAVAGTAMLLFYLVILRFLRRATQVD